MAATETRAACEGRNQSSEKSTLQVMILGDREVGKSCLMKEFVGKSFDEHSLHTGKVKFFNRDIEVAGQTHTLLICEPPVWHESWETMQTAIFQGTDICLLMYSINKQTSFTNLAVWRNKFPNKNGKSKDQNKGSVAFLVVGNKVDLPGEKRMVFMKDVEPWCLKNDLTQVEISAKDPMDVERVFTSAVETWALQKEKRDKKDRQLV